MIHIFFLFTSCNLYANDVSDGLKSNGKVLTRRKWCNLNGNWNCFSRRMLNEWLWVVCERIYKQITFMNFIVIFLTELIIIIFNLICTNHTHINWISIWCSSLVNNWLMAMGRQRASLSILSTCLASPCERPHVQCRKQGRFYPPINHHIYQP